MKNSLEAIKSRFEMANKELLKLKIVEMRNTHSEEEKKENWTQPQRSVEQNQMYKVQVIRVKRKKGRIDLKEWLKLLKTINKPKNINECKVRYVQKTHIGRLHHSQGAGGQKKKKDIERERNS